MKYPRLWAACLALVPLAVCPALAQAPPNAPSPAAPALTGPITKISIVGLKNVSMDTVQAKMTLKVGDTYTPEAAQKDAAALQNIGVFNGQVSVAATPAPPSGVSLTYTVAENPIVQSIKFTANMPSGQPSVPAADLIAQMKTRTGQVLNTNILVKDLDNLFNHTTGYMYQLGFIFDVSSDINIDPKIGLLTIPLVEAHIKSIEITGNSRVKTADILAQMHAKSGDLYNANNLQNDLYAIYGTGEFRQVGPFQVSSSVVGELKISIPMVEQPAATGSLDEKQGKVIPFLYDPLAVPYPVVQVSVNGHTPLPFVVDTGTTAPLSLNPWAAKELGLTPSSRVEKTDAFTFSRAPVESVVLRGKKPDNDTALNIHEAFVMDLGLFNLAIPRPHIAGVIGIGALVSATSRFDFAGKTLTIFTAPHPPLRILGGTTVPLNYFNDIANIHVSLASATSADLVFDTGSDGTQIPLSALDALHPAALAFGGYYVRIDKVFVCPALRLLSMKIGSLQVLNTAVGTLPSPSLPSLGMDILAGYRLTFDGPNAQLFFEPSLQGGRYTLGWSGVSLKKSGDRWAIDTFRSGSPAQSAGLKAGDEIVAVNGISIAGVSQAFCKRSLGGLAGQRVQTTVQRDGSRIVIVSWTAVDDFHAPPKAIDGLVMQKPTGDCWIVSEVIKGYPGDKAGLQAGDKLTKISGEATVIMSEDRFGQLASKPSVLLEVERPGVAQPFTVWLTASKQP